MLESMPSKVHISTQLSVVEIVNNISIIPSCLNLDSVDGVFACLTEDNEHDVCISVND